MSRMFKTIKFVYTSDNEPAIWVENSIHKGRELVDDPDFEGDKFMNYWQTGETILVARPDGSRPFAAVVKGVEGRQALVPLRRGCFIIRARFFDEGIPGKRWNVRVWRVTSLSHRKRTARLEVVHIGRRTRSSDKYELQWTPPLRKRLEGAVEQAMEQSVEWSKFWPYVENLPHSLLYGRFDKHLLSPGEALERVRWYNRRYWGRRFTGAPLANAAIQLAALADHKQTVTDLILPHVTTGNPAQDAKLWLTVLEQEWGRCRGVGDLASHLSRLCYSDGVRVVRYGPGIHWVRVNLLAWWDIQRNRSREEDLCGLGFANGEVFSALGINTGLLGEFASADIPCFHLRGFDSIDGPPSWLSLDPEGAGFKERGLWLWSGEGKPGSREPWGLPALVLED